MILRDKDTSAAWTASADVTGVVVDGVLEERLYYAQNWRADVSLIIGASGGLIERVKYSAYGVPFCMSRADYNGDGAVTSADDTAFMADYNADDIRADFNYDGTTDFADYLDFVAIYNGGGGESGGGRSSMSSPSINNRIGYAGYQWDPSIRGSITGTGGASAGKYHVRHRVLDAGQGRWTRRDLLGYVDGASVYQYVRSAPHRSVDPRGLKGVIFTLIPDDNLAPVEPWTPPPPPPPPKTIPECPEQAPGTGPGTLTDGWCSEGISRTHCNLPCYRSYNGTTGGQQCCYNQDGSLNRNPYCMGTIDLVAPSDGEFPDGTCISSPWRVALHFYYDVTPWLIMGNDVYAQIHCCMRRLGVPSGTPGAPVTDDELEDAYKDCQSQVINLGRAFCNRMLE